MSTPKRIQRKRTKGWRMPEGAVYVGRPTVFGNPAVIERGDRGLWHVWAGDVGPLLRAATSATTADGAATCGTAWTAASRPAPA